MTAEIGILNRQGVALAADSAVTIGINGKQKVLNSANKLFNLIKGFPVGLMVYGDGDFLRVPWDIIINEYRRQYNDTKQYNTLYEYCEDFMEKLKSDKYYSTEAYKGNIYRALSTYMNPIINKTKDNLSEKYPNVEVTPAQVLEIFTENVSMGIENLENLDFVNKFDESDIKILLSDEINIEVVNEYLHSILQFKFEGPLINLVRKLNALLQCKECFCNYSGIVIAGYGEKELFPKLYEFHVEGIINNKLKYKLVKEAKIYGEGNSKNVAAEIIPFAQQEMVHSVLSGMDPNIEQLLTSNLQVFINSICDIAQKTFNCVECENNKNNLQKLKKDSIKQLELLMNHINTIRKKFYVSPVFDMVASLPKDELATMAETLVNLTSFKRKITMDAETVGGPIDVAIISKSEGFIWMKRKLYFSKDLNRHYVDNN